MTITLLIESLLKGDHEAAVEAVHSLRQEGLEPQTIVLEGIEPAMLRMDNRCTVEQFNLLELMLTGRAIAAVIRELYPHGTPRDSGRATFVAATLQGDVHELGKNILKSVLLGKGYRVVDCGKDCAVDSLINAAQREQAQAVLVSGLMTSVIPQVRTVKARLAERGLTEMPVLAGGAALKQASAAALQVDYVAENAFDGAHYLDTLFGGGA